MKFWTIDGVLLLLLIAIYNALTTYLVHGIDNSGANQRINFLGSQSWKSTHYLARFEVAEFDLYPSTGPIPFNDHFWIGGYGHNPITGKSLSEQIQE